MAAIGCAGYQTERKACLATDRQSLYRLEMRGDVEFNPDHYVETKKSIATQAREAGK